MANRDEWLAFLAQLGSFITYAYVIGYWLLPAWGVAGTLAWCVAFALFGLAWFAVAMRLRDRRLKQPWRALTVVVTGVGYVFDVLLLNWVVGQILFPFDRVREFPLTARLRRLRNNRRRTALERYHARVATALCRLLNKYDRKGHC